MTLITRRSILRGLFAMPAVCSVEILMPVRGIVMEWERATPWWFIDQIPLVLNYADAPYSFVIPSHIVEAIGEGNHAAGTLILERIFNRLPLTPDTTPPSADGA